MTEAATRRVFACLWRGEDLPSYSNDQYGVDDVARLAAGVRRSVAGGELTLLHDVHYGKKLREQLPEGHGINLVELEDLGNGGWTNMLEIFRPDLRPGEGERHLLVGLDTVFWGNCDWLFHWTVHPLGLPLDPYHAPTPCDAVVSFDGEGAAMLWDFYLEEWARDGMASHLLAGKPSEMMLMRALYSRHAWTPLEPRPRSLLSYKVHVHRQDRAAERLADASLVYFHGTPKPADLEPGNPVYDRWVSGDAPRESVLEYCPACVTKHAPMAPCPPRPEQRGRLTPGGLDLTP